jgi:hypothetical protein
MRYTVEGAVKMESGRLVPWKTLPHRAARP